MAYIGSSPTKVVSRQSANIFTYTATANQTAFTGSDANGNTLACTPSDIMVHMNGLRLEKSDYVATTTTVTLGSGAAAGDEVTITAFLTFETADAYTKSAADTRYVNASGDTMTGALTGTSAGFTGDVNIGNNDASNPVSKLRLGATLYGAADIVPVSTGHKIGLDFKTDSTGDTTIDPVTRMSISNEGYVTKPYQPSFGAYQATGNYTVGSGWGKMIADGTRWNEGSHYSTTNSRFTAPLAGVYHFTANVNSYAIADDLLFGVALYVNGSGHTMGNRFYSRGGSDIVASMSHTVKLSTTDYVEIYYYSNDTSHGFSSGTVWNTFSGFLVG